MAASTPGSRAARAGSATRRDWSRRAERHAMALHPALLAEAQQNSRLLGDPVLLLGLAREIALARGPELTLAYRSVVMVQPGFKQRTGADPAQLEREPCVVFVVRRKWAPGEADPSHPQHLPPWLVTFAEHGGRRLPFAVRTDVQPEAGFSGAQAQTGSLWLQPPAADWDHGAAACAVRLRSDGGDVLCLLSAQHVLTPVADVDALAVLGGLAALPLDGRGRRLDAPRVATTLEVGGVLRGDEDPLRPSFDVQLARIDDLAASRTVVGARTLAADEPWIRTPERLWSLATQRWFHLLVPVDHPQQPGRAPLRARLDAPLTLPLPLRYRVRRGGRLARIWIYHDELLKFQLVEPPFPIAGDSGCAVVLLQPDGSATLAGLYIGGDGDTAYAIPAWQLVDMDRWWSFPAGASVTPVSL